ncbi:hypothetical protein DPM19_29120 [Actinomadura craniellae]|uniref:DUF4234 domain-containing protein n=1 Tax=Actinomadura craniellae TaxID=2231787 RepID=A0A365GXZ0_9ACTN|nr:DUF4234 domain-containing protein [Actinomadura craniellae]RAY11686.1 hypothetical protein DPM19_29120 [Actinomadura craniellae]
MSYPQQGQPYQQASGQGGYAPMPAQNHAPASSGYNMKRRNPVGVWLGMPIITLGFYGIFWFFKVHSELADFDRRRNISSTNALLSILFGWITLYIWPLIVAYQLGNHIRDAQRAAGLQPTCSGGVGILLYIFLFGSGSLYYQIELNKVVDRYGSTPPGQQVPLAA